MSDPVNNSTVSKSLVSDVRKELITQFSKWLIGAFAVLLGLAASGWYWYIKHQLELYTRPVPVGAIVMFEQECPSAEWVDIVKEDQRLKGAYIRLTDDDITKRGGRTTITIQANNVPRLNLQTTNSHHADDVAAYTKSGSKGEDKEFSFFKGGDGSGGAAYSTFGTLYVGDSNPAPIILDPNYVQMRLCRKK